MPDMVDFNGRKVVAGWPEKAAESQKAPTCIKRHKEYDRIKYGDEADDWGADNGPCHDCAVVKGQYHVFGCDAERCPRCGGQIISCSC